mgnify:CR=1 FL=1
MKNQLKHLVFATVVATGMQGVAFADVNIGVVVSATGPGATIGADVVRTAELFKSLNPQVGGQKLNIYILDDASDVTTGVKNTKKLIAEQSIDAFVGSNTTGPATGMAQVATEDKVTMFAIAPINLATIKSPWVFRASQAPIFFVERIIADMSKNGVTNTSFIGFADGWGDLLYNGLKEEAPKAGIKILAEERFKRPDTTVTAQMLRVLAPHPESVFIGAAGTPAILPQTVLNQQGYKGRIYQNAVASKEFIRVGGQEVEGALVPVGTIMVNEQLPDTNPSKLKGKKFLEAYEGKYGPGSRSMFAGYAWDAFSMLRNAAQAALKAGAKPGTAEFRKALRDAVETGNYVGATGKYAFTAANHGGLTADSLVMVKLESGQWKLVK